MFCSSTISVCGVNIKDKSVTIVTKDVGVATLHDWVKLNENVNLNLLCIIGKQLINAIKIIHSIGVTEILSLLI